LPFSLDKADSKIGRKEIKKLHPQVAVEAATNALASACAIYADVRHCFVSLSTGGIVETQK
jgi:hypothetical protein